ncbi:hypothetical protein [Thiohalocapsa marina]|uniref:hypothetical protein n=1 Tax=Thiohalocapsa marina TaxID=424902 RepID=UPI001B860EE4|nr:hypothetical protein [Thiohalocapsa marina]
MSADPSRLIAALARDRITLDLSTLDLCFLAGLYLRCALSRGGSRPAPWATCRTRRRRRFDQRIAAEQVRTKVAEALRRLADLGFIDVLDDTRLRPALMRFAEPVRDLSDPRAGR